MDAGPARAGRIYLIAGTSSGTSPGTNFGGLTVPINCDGLTRWLINNRSSPVLERFAGRLDSSGRGSAGFAPPPGSLSPFAGRTLHFAFVTLETAPLAADFASQPVSLEVTP
jgi:hypothetical protein